MMQCVNCGFATGPEDHFCEGCGGRLDAAAVAVQRCACGSTQFDREGYCAECGQRYRAPVQTSGVAIETTIAWATHPGRVHEENQDAGGVVRLADGSVLLVVSDGVSSADRAREASALAVSTILAHVERHLGMAREALLCGAVEAAHAALLTLSRENLHKDDPQATIVVAHVVGREVQFAWVGDSRIYALHAEAMYQLTEDDSWLNEAVRSGTPYAVALRDRNAHCITQCLGMREYPPEVHLGQVSLPVGTQLLLCSDGLWNYYSTPSALMRATPESMPPLTALQWCEALVAAANESGGVDNITVAVMGL